MFPKHTNSQGTIFGGVILSYLDIAAAEHARDHSCQNFVTKVVKEVNFISPVFVGDKVSFYTETTKVGTTSITIKVTVEAEGRLSNESVKVTEAEVVMVAIDDQGNPTTITKKS